MILQPLLYDIISVARLVCLLRYYCMYACASQSHDPARAGQLRSYEIRFLSRTQLASALGIKG